MKRVLTAVAFSFALLGAAQAQTTGRANTDLNLRSGPGPEQPVIGLIKARQQAAIIGCVEGSFWCQVQFRGKTGWAYSQYMTLASASGTIVVREPGNLAAAPVLAYDGPAYRPTYRPDVAPLAAAITAPAVIGAAALSAPAAFLNPPPYAVNQYVAANATNSFYYQGDVVVGANLPQTVVLNNVPDYRYQYVYVNDTPVLVDPVTRQIVYVFRQ